jgi:hypothetical protein
MTSKKKSWIEKRDCNKVPHVKIIDKAFSGVPKGSKLLISSPKEINDFIHTIPKNIQLEPREMRNILAKKHNADATCPVSTGIFLRIVAEAAIEEYNNGKTLNEICPFWRIIRPTSTIGKKLTISDDEFENMKLLAN